MFKAPFSFDGRIRRLEYGLSILIYSFAAFILQIVFTLAIAMSPDQYRIALIIVFLVMISPLLWFLWAQGAKRCHDLGKSGWWQLIPLYALWMLFEDGQIDINYYGDDPKGPRL